VSGATGNDYYASYLDPALRVATRVCALPHWLDDDLGLELLELVGHNGTSRAMLARVKRLPVVMPFGRTCWRIEKHVREYFVEELSKAPDYARLSSLLAERFARDHDEAQDPAERDARVAQWRAAYHFAEIDPRESVARLCDVVTDAGNRERIADVEAAIELFEEKASLASFEIEAAYARGRLAYLERDYRAARKFLGVVWAAQASTRETAVAGHLLGVIDIKEKSSDHETQQILRAAAQVATAVEDRLNLYQILNTLVNHLLDHHEGASLADIEELALEEADVTADLGAEHQAAAYITLGQVQIRRGRNHFAAARQCLQNAVQLSEASGRTDRSAVALLSSSWLAVSDGRVHEAIGFMDRALQINIHAAADENTPVTARRLAKLVASLDEPLHNWLMIERSAECFAYWHNARLVLVGYTPGIDHPVTIPNEFSGVWEDRDRGVRFKLGETVALRSLLGRHMGVVLTKVNG